MGRKVHPVAYRLGVNKESDSRYFASRWHFTPYLKIDEAIRNYLLKIFQKGIIEKIELEHASNTFRLIIHTPRPGLVVGKQGAQTKQIEKKVQELLESHRNSFRVYEPSSRAQAEGKQTGLLKSRGKEKQPLVSIDIREVKEPETKSSLVAQEIASQLERRMPYRKTIKGMLSKLMRHKEVKGAKIKVKGRLDGAEIARCEWVSAGSVPLQTLRSDIDYSFYQAITKFGTIGVKIWIYKGEIFKPINERTET